MSATITQDYRPYDVLVATNPVTNPSFELNTTGWAGTSATIARATTQQHSGVASCSVICTAQDNRVTTAITPGAKPSANNTADVWIKGEAGKLARLVIFEYTAADALVGNTAGGDVTMTGAWQRISVTRLFGATGTKFAIAAQNRTAGAHTFYIDDVDLNAGADYFDGSTPDTVDYRYDWVGTADASASTKKERASESAPSTPDLIIGYETKRKVATNTHRVLGTPNVVATLRPASLRSGHITYYYRSESEVHRAELMHAQGISALTLVDTDRFGTMKYVPQGDIVVKLNPDTRDTYTLEFDFQEVAA